MTVSIFFNKKRKIITWIFSIVLITILLFSESYWENISLLSDIFFFIGALLVGIATMGRLWCALYISGYKTQTLIKIGPYSMCRNPLYFFSLLGALGIGLATESLFIPFVIFIFFLLYYPFVIQEEENNLSKLHEKEFETYCKNTPKFIPSFSQFNEPEQSVIFPKIFRKNLFDALWFIWLFGLIEFLEALHERRIIPIFFKRL